MYCVVQYIIMYILHFEINLHFTFQLNLCSSAICVHFYETHHLFENSNNYWIFQSKCKIWRANTFIESPGTWSTQEKQFLI